MESRCVFNNQIPPVSINLLRFLPTICVHHVNIIAIIVILMEWAEWPRRRLFIWSTPQHFQHTAHSSMCAANCTLHTVQTLHTARCTLCTIHTAHYPTSDVLFYFMEHTSTLSTHCTLFNMCCTSHTANCTLCTFCTLPDI